MSVMGSERAAVRFPVAATALVAAAAHVPVTGEHLREAPYIGVLFIALEVALVVLAGLVLVSTSRLVWWAAAVVPALAVVAYAVSRTVGLPQIGDDVGNWTEPLGVVSVVAETLMVLLVVARGISPVRRLHGRLLPAVLATALLVVGFALVAAEPATAASFLVAR